LEKKVRWRVGERKSSCGKLRGSGGDRYKNIVKKSFEEQ